MALRTHNIREDMLPSHVLIAPRECRRPIKAVQRENLHHYRSLCVIYRWYVVHTKRSVEHNAILNIAHTASVVRIPVHGLRLFIPLFKLFSHGFACVFIKRCVRIRHSIRCHARSRLFIIVSNWVPGIQISRQGKTTAQSSSLLSMSKNCTSNRPRIASTCTAKSGTNAHHPTKPPTQRPIVYQKDS